jgi:hypothetical protein
MAVSPISDRHAASVAVVWPRSFGYSDKSAIPSRIPGSQI